MPMLRPWIEAHNVCIELVSRVVLGGPCDCEDRGAGLRCDSIRMRRGLSCEGRPTKTLKV